jgi:hypothetical protein
VEGTSKQGAKKRKKRKHGLKKLAGNKKQAWKGHASIEKVRGRGNTDYKFEGNKERKNNKEGKMRA